MACDVLYLSPHADDVAFSAAAQVRADVLAGHRVAVWTLFTAAGGPAWCGDATTRRAEDEAFAALMGVQLLAPAWPDAIVRRPRYGKARHRLAPLSGDETSLVDALVERLATLVASGCRRVVAPLGVGEHVDHQIAHAAAARLRGCEIRFYEDTPYVLTPYQLGRRFARLDLAPTGDATLQRGSPTAELAATARAWWGSPLLGQLVALPLRPFAVATLLAPQLLDGPPRRAGQRRAVAELLAGSEVGEVRRAAIACYPSQWPQFYPSLEAFRAALAGYATAMGETSIVERWWRIIDPQPGAYSSPSK